jgi:glutamate-1-semialdehyde 2,1-aminomutase
VFVKQGDQVAAVIIEPFAGNMNLIKPSKEFLSTLRQLTSQHGSVLIYD